MITFRRLMYGYLRVLSCWAFVLATLLFVCVDASASASELVIYSGRKESAIKPVVDLFERETGIKVALKVGKTSGLANEILQERQRPRADILIATEAGICEILVREGLLEPYVSPGARAIPAEHKSSRGLWTGISGRAGHHLQYGSGQGRRHSELRIGPDRREVEGEDRHSRDARADNSFLAERPGPGDERGEGQDLHR